MKILKLFCLSLALATLSAHAQVGQCNSAYSRFGLGLSSEQGQGFNRSMSGVGIGLRGGNIVNSTNPASYAAIDSMSFILDVGMSLNMGDAVQGKVATNYRNASMDYVTMGFRLRKGLGMSLGFMPISRIGYSFQKRNVVAFDPATMTDITSYSTYRGEGGLHEVYAGLGWNPFDRLSIGVNAGYLWGECNHQMVQTFEENGVSSSTFSPMSSVHAASLSSYMLEFGVQYPINLSKEDVLTVGATATIGHRIASDATLTRNAGDADTPVDTLASPYDVPYKVGIGASWSHGKSWLVAADAQYEMWGDCHTARWDKAENRYVATLGEYKNRVKVAAGMQYTPNPLDKHYLQRMQYRAGIRYSSPNLVINGQDGPHEYGFSLGVGLPITNVHNNRSQLNVGFQYLRRSAAASGLVTENCYMITVGMTFNEMWFMKFKIN